VLKTGCGTWTIIEKIHQIHWDIEPNYTDHALHDSPIIVFVYYTLDVKLILKCHWELEYILTYITYIHVSIYITI
jgi:hypothetical protein